ncbi:hypothetical protein BAY61_26245 [Prauserella marina]|uniref:UPF0434 protein SAMN05421630_111186 n=1 Tax=Prauserella marina TaxID=530584 RepID=A0A222VVG9_9PSEU|nr:Trm112 family protein [Prauserella marina]ASR37929.1 hypothetical protein BAY61_26245 [Prauserella marina]PWV73138.1 hypothetical protein DES30_10987 [Prauserella marina]SDD70935.1 hypothetical protein SAMN05421630_111186 [Prauserella marina]
MAVTLDAQLLEILACPSQDHAPLTPGSPGDPDADALTCTSCGRVFPVKDGIPVLLLDEASAPTVPARAVKGERETRDDPGSDGA